MGGGGGEKACDRFDTVVTISFALSRAASHPSPSTFSLWQPDSYNIFCNFLNFLAVENLSQPTMCHHCIARYALSRLFIASSPKYILGTLTGLRNTEVFVNFAAFVWSIFIMVILCYVFDSYGKILILFWKFIQYTFSHPIISADCIAVKWKTCKKSNIGHISTTCLNGRYILTKARINKKEKKQAATLWD